jgi:hypothetical protein
MADTDAPTEPVEAATAPAPAPVEDEATPGGDVNTGPAENLREVSMGPCALLNTLLGIVGSIIHIFNRTLTILVLPLRDNIEKLNSQPTPRPTWKLPKIS